MPMARKLGLTGALMVAALAFAGAAEASYVTADLNMRNGPGTNYRIIATIPGASSVRVYSCVRSWCKVKWRGARGWVARNYISSGAGYAEELLPPPIDYGYGYYHERDRDWDWRDDDNDRGRRRDPGRVEDRERLSGQSRDRARERYRQQRCDFTDCR